MLNTEKVFCLEYLFTFLDFFEDFSIAFQFFFLDFTLLTIEINVIFPINWKLGNLSEFLFHSIKS